MYFQSFVEQLQLELENLPGEEAQYRMSPQFRMKPDEARAYYANARLSAVLILFYPKDDGIFTTLIQRPTYEGVHSGQVAFPGGKKEVFDPDLKATALREASEEVGLETGAVKVLGPLTPLYIPPSNFMVTPFVAYTPQMPALRKDDHEVAEILEVDIDVIKDPLLTGVKKIMVRDIEVESPYFDINGRIVWGATAMMLSELREILARPIFALSKSHK